MSSSPVLPAPLGSSRRCMQVCWKCISLCDSLKLHGLQPELSVPYDYSGRILEQVTMPSSADLPNRDRPYLSWVIKWRKFLHLEPASIETNFHFNLKGTVLHSCITVSSAEVFVCWHY